MIAAYVLWLLLHEAGHVLAGYLVGIKPQSIILGTGPIVRQGNRWQLRRWPLGCAVILGETGQKFSTGRVALTLVGPLLLSLLLWWLPIGPFLIVVNLTQFIPIPMSDGRQLLRLFQPRERKMMYECH